MQRCLLCELQVCTEAPTVRCSPLVYCCILLDPVIYHSNILSA